MRTRGRGRGRGRRWSAAAGTAVLAAAALGTPAAAEEEVRPGRCASSESASASAVGAAPGAGDTVPRTPVPPGVCALTADPPPPLMNLRHVTLGAAGGKPGARVRVSAVGFTPGAAVTVEGRAGTARTADRVRATADRYGSLGVELPVTDRATTGVVAYEGPAWSALRGSGPAPYAVTAAAAVAGPGALTMTQAGAAVTLGTVAYGAGGAAAGRIGTVTVKDTRGGGGGRWKLTARLTGFTGRDAAGAPGAVLSWTPSCRGGCTAGAAGEVGPEGAVLATGGGGTATVDAALSLTLPAYTPPGAYRAVLTLTLQPS